MVIFDEGVILLLGVEKIEGVGNYYVLMVLGNVIVGMIGFCQELFGLVVILIIVCDVDYVLVFVNDSEFGLFVMVYIIDEVQVQCFVCELECGGVFFNGYCVSDVCVVFGGVKKSGFGWELLYFGLYEFCNVQIVWKDCC